MQAYSRLFHAAQKRLEDPQEDSTLNFPFCDIEFKAVKWAPFPGDKFESLRKDPVKPRGQKYLTWELTFQPFGKDQAVWRCDHPANHIFKNETHKAVITFSFMPPRQNAEDDEEPMATCIDLSDVQKKMKELLNRVVDVYPKGKDIPYPWKVEWENYNAVQKRYGAGKEIDDPRVILCCARACVLLECSLLTGRSDNFGYRDWTLDRSDKDAPI